MTSIEIFLSQSHGLPKRMNLMQLVDYVVDNGWWNEFLNFLDNSKIN